MKLFACLSLMLIIMSCTEADLPMNKDVSPEKPGKDEVTWLDTLNPKCLVVSSLNTDSLYQLWKANEPRHYTYQARKTCFCTPFALQVVIKDSQIDTGYLLDSEIGYLEFMDRTELASVARSELQKVVIDSLFGTIRHALRYDPFLYSASFDSKLNFPCSFYFDIDENLFDEEFGVSIDSFMVAEY